MTIFSRLTVLIILGCLGTWVVGAPPRVTGNRPVVIEVPVPDGEPLFPAAVRADPRDRELLALLFPDDPAESAAANEGELPTPTSVLNQAGKQLLKYTSVSAKIVETVAIGDRSFKAEGRYLQRALKTNDWHMRLELAVKLGESTGSLLEVCDGEVLWTRTEIDSGRKRERKEGKETSLTRRNISEIMSAARKLGDQKTESALIASFGLGGLPALIVGIERDMKLTAVKEESLNGRPVYMVQGVWGDAFMQNLPRGAGSQPASTMMLPNVPDSVRVYVDRETGMPYRFLYLKKIPGRDVSRAMLTLDFLDVALNEPINAAEFTYTAPEGVTAVEQTKFFVELLTPRDNKSQPGSSSK